MNNRITQAVFRTSIASIITICFITGSCTNPTTIELSFEDYSDSSDADEQTIGSIQKISGMYIVNYHGDYEDRMRWLNEYHSTESAKKNTTTDCSLFAAYTKRGKPLLGRNFDRPRETPILGKFAAPGKYASFAFSPASEVNLNEVVGTANPSEEQRDKFLYCLPFYATDGINEKGLSIAIAGAPPRKINSSENSNRMFVLYFIRKVLDNCKNVDEVAQLAETVSLYDSDYNTISHHFIAVDASGKWLVIDYPEGKLRLAEGQGVAQIRTNHFLEGGPAIEKTSFWRYDKLYKALNSNDSLDSKMEAMGLLKQVRNSSQWSVIYESSTPSGVFVVHEDFKTQYRFSFMKNNP